MEASDRHALAALSPENNHGSHCSREWVGLKAGPEEYGDENPGQIPGFEIRSVQPLSVFAVLTTLPRPLGYGPMH